MPSAEHEGAGPAESVQQRQGPTRPQAACHRQHEQHERGERQTAQGERAGKRFASRRHSAVSRQGSTPGFRFRSFPQGQRADPPPGQNRHPLACSRRPKRHQHGGTHRHRRPQAVRGHLPAHAPDGLRHDGHRHEFQAVQPAGVRRAERVRPSVQSEGKADHEERRRPCEAEPGGDAACEAGAQHADADADLAAGRSGQELAKRRQVRVAAGVQPFSPADVFVVKIPEMRGRAPEGSQSQFRRCQENADDFFHLFVILMRPHSLTVLFSGPAGISFFKRLGFDIPRTL